LVGWVRNRHDGSVEAVIAGGAAGVDALVAWAHRGPRAARVTRVEVRSEADSVAAGFDGIEQRATG
jgi:acylphosphatase